jgi:hypothetical protein
MPGQDPGQARRAGRTAGPPDRAQHAAAQLTGLAEQAAVAAQAVRETLQRATLAAEALALPEAR